MKRFDRVLRCWRVMEELTIRQAAKQIGISAATLMRIEHGRNFDAATLAKILQWMMTP